MITDTAGNEITALPLTIDAGQTSQVLVINVPCLAGKFLASSVEADAQVKARRHGSGDSFTDIGASPIDLSDFAGEVVQFDIETVASGSVNGIEHLAIPVRVTFNP